MDDSFGLGSQYVLPLQHKGQEANPRITSRLPLDRLYQVGAINTTAWKRVHTDGFGTTRDPERRPKAAVVPFRR